MGSYFLEDAMTQYIAIEGYVEDTKSDPTVILLLDGMTISVSKAGIHKLAVADTAKNPLSRVFLEPDAEVAIFMKAKDMMGGDAGTAGTILKWLDDGGTISKSRDDSQNRWAGGGTIAKWLDDGGTIKKSYDDV